MNEKSLALLLLSFSLFSVAAQQPQQPAQSPTPPRTSAAQATKESDDAQDVVRITTNLVQVDVVVTKDGKVITDLKPEDFELLEDGRPQKITHFSYVSRVPNASITSLQDKNAGPVITIPPHFHDVRRTVALVVDDLGVSFESIVVLRQQVRKFLDEQLQPNDLVAIIRTGGEVGALQQFTSDRRLLESAFDHLQWNPCSRAGFGFQAVMSPIQCGVGSTSLKTTLRSLRFVLQGMRDLPGRKSMVVFTDNLPLQPLELGPLKSPYEGLQMSDPGNPPQTTNRAAPEGIAPSDPGALDNSNNLGLLFERIVELAVRGSVVIYAVDTRGLQYTGMPAADGIPIAQPIATRPPDATIDAITRARLQMEQLQRRSTEAGAAELRRGRTGAQQISSRTGGFPVFNSNDFGLKRIMDDQEGYYLLGYRPGDQTFNRSFHHLAVRVKRHGLSARTREGFYGVSDEEARPRQTTVLDQINGALVSPFGVNDITVRLNTVFADDATAGPLLRSFVFLDPRALTFRDQADGTHEATFDLSCVLFGDNGAIVRRQDQTATLRLRGKPYDRSLREGIVYSFELPVKQVGDFQFRVAVRDKISSRLGTAGQFITVPNLGKHLLALSGIVVRDEANLPGSFPPNHPVDAENEANRDPAVRGFRAGATLNFAYEVYNAQLETTSQTPRLTTQMRLFRDGKPIYVGGSRPLEVIRGTNLQRITANARLQLGTELPPGQYFFQIIVEDLFSREKQRTATQWIDFKVVK